MIARPNASSEEAAPAPLSLFPDPLLRLRVRAADFARMLGVSRQSVTRWKQQGLIVIGPDGRLDPDAETRRLLRSVDPTQLRAKMLRPLADEIETVRRELDLTRAERDRALAQLGQAKTERDELKASNQELTDEIAGLRREAGFRDLTEVNDHNEENDDE